MRRSNPTVSMTLYAAPGQLSKLGETVNLCHLCHLSFLEAATPTHIQNKVS